MSSVATSGESIINRSSRQTDSPVFDRDRPGRYHRHSCKQPNIQD